MFIMSMTLIFIPVFMLMGFNYYIDPYWNFSHSNNNNDYQNGFDERLQKTNLLASNPPDFESLLIGSSRVTYMNSDNFQHEQVFNYSLSSMHIDEYNAYITYAEKVKGSSIEKIYMELPLHSYYANTPLPQELPEVYFEKAEDRLLDFTSLFSKDTYEKSMDNYKASQKNVFSKQRSYTRGNQVETTYPSRIEEARESFKGRYDKNGYTKTFEYKEDYKAELFEIKQQHTETKIIPFTDLAHIDRLKIYLKNPNYFDAYEKSILEIIDVYGELITFHLENELTTEDKYWLDFFHYYPNVGDAMINSLESGEGEGEIFEYINKDNVESYLANLKKLVNEPVN